MKAAFGILFSLLCLGALTLLVLKEDRDPNGPASSLETDGSTSLEETPNAASSEGAVRRHEKESIPPDHVYLRVIGATGAPAANALIHLWIDDLEVTPPLGETNQHGEASLRIPESATEIEARAEGSSGRWPILRGSRQTLWIRPPSEIRVMVQPESLSVEFDVELLDWQQPGGRPSLLSLHQNPSFTTLSFSSGGLWSIRARDGERVTETAYLWVQDPRTAPVTLRFFEGLRLEGEVRGPDGAPVGLAKVRLFPLSVEGAAIGELVRPGVATTSPTGHFAIAVAHEGDFILTARGKGLASSHPHQLSFSATNPHEFVRLDLSREASIRGRVVHSNGEPIAFVKVRTEPRVPDLGNLPGNYLAQAYDSPSVYTDVDGSFRLQGLHPELLYFIDVRPSSERPHIRIVREGLVAGLDGIEIIVSESELQGHSVRGRVLTNATGRPVGSYDLFVVSDQGTRFTLLVEHPNGEFEVDGLSPGDKYRLQVRADGHSAGTSEWFSVEGQVEPVLIRLQQSGALDIVARGSSNADWVLVGITRVGQPEYLSRMRFGKEEKARFRNLEPGTYRIRIGQDSEPIEVEIHEGRTSQVEVDL